MSVARASAYDHRSFANIADRLEPGCKLFKCPPIRLFILGAADWLKLYEREGGRLGAMSCFDVSDLR